MNKFYFNSIKNIVLTSKPSKAIRLLLMVLFVCLFVNVASGQTTLFQFNFENSTSANVDNVVGTPIFTANGVAGPGYSTNTPCGNARMYTAANWDAGDNYRFAVNTTGYGNMTFSFCNRTDNVAIGTFLVRVSSDSGSTWDTVLATYTPTTSNTTLTTATFPITSNNAALVWIEISKVSGAGNARTLLIDNATLSGYPVPTISSFTPNSGCSSSTPVVITGTNFIGVTAVRFGETNADSFVVNSSTQITAIPSSGNTGIISVLAIGGTATSGSSFTVNTAPSTTGTITPATCNASDGAITIAGLENVPIEFKNADSDYIDLGATYLSNRSAFTVEGWIKFNIADLAGTSRISLFGQNDVVEFGFINPTTIELYTAGGGSFTTPIPASLGNNAWHHIAAVGNGTNMIIYIDGVSVGTGGSATGNYGASLFTAKIGAGVIDATGGGYPGQIKKVGFYNTALSAATIAFLSSTPTTYTGSEAGLLAGYNFSEGIGTTLTRLPAGTNGTLTNSPQWIYTYAWTKTGTPAFTESTKNISGLSAGVYNLSIGIIGTSCTKTTSFSVSPTNVYSTSWSLGTPTANQNIEFTGNYNVPTDVTACSCTVNSGAVNIKTGNNLILGGKLTVNGGTLTFEDTSSLVQTTAFTGANSGNITYKRITAPIRQTDYTYWSSPVKPMAGGGYLLGSIATSQNYLSYDSTVKKDWKFENASTQMGNGVGYAIQGPSTMAGSPYSASFVGVPNNGNITVPVIFTNPLNLLPTHPNYGVSYLLGNPYPSAINADTFLSINAGVLDGTLYFWTHYTEIGLGTSNLGSGALAYTSDDYASYNYTGGVSGTGYAAPTIGSSAIAKDIPNGKIAAGQGFFATSIASGNVIFNNSMRLAGSTLADKTGTNQQFFKTKSPAKTASTIEKHRVWLNLSNTQGAFKQTLVGYIADATNDYDSRFDGESFDGNEFVDFYSVNQDKNLVIQGRALPFNANDEVPLGFRTTINGSFTINIDQVDGLLANQPVFIEDKLTNTLFDLKSGNYSFNTAAGTFNDRFVLRYSNKTLGTTDFDVKENIVLVSIKNKQIKINSFVDTIEKVTIFDLLGRQIYQKDKINSNEFLFTDLRESHETLIVKTSLQNGKTVSEKIIF